MNLDLTLLHLAFGNSDPEERMLLYGIAFGPFAILVVAMVWVHRQNVRDASAPEEPSGEDMPNAYEAPQPGQWTRRSRPPGGDDPHREDEAPMRDSPDCERPPT